MQMSLPWTSHLDLFGSPECDYHAQVTIGSTLMNLVLDTGSSNTAVISDLCQDNCSFVKKPYLPVPNINDFDSVNASYGNAKLRSAWKGFATKQLVTFEGVEQTFSRIDAITENQSFFIPRCSENQGIWGLAYPSLLTKPTSQFSQEPLFDAIRKEKALPNAFTYQICPKSAVDSTFAHEINFLSQNVLIRNMSSKTIQKECLRDGHFWLGGYPSHSVASEIVWVPLSHQRYYQVKIESFLVNNETVGMEDINMPRTIVDTGTKDIVLSPQNLQKLLNALWHSKLVQFDPVVSKEHEKSFWFDHARLTIPRNAITIAHNVSLQIEFEDNNRVSIPIENILNIKPFGQDWVNISWTGFSNSDGKMASTILGNTLLRGKTVIFDRGDKSRVGFADAFACCDPSSGQDVNVLLSVDNSSSSIQLIQDRHENTIQIFLLALVGVSTLVFISTLALVISNRYRKTVTEKIVGI
ncbi:aspartic peptidase domain-containing protein [Mucor mucedo]|uniref:aspartic peptidase domain-containing protein n=1 Tax=Mucor mucedo TaxID=29922 RepID=UPI0022200023|nr:aspartic peptidase domain-containing protein [Mucor mucedo]KAI7897220.1 aspartic peptidase domain-containing protein [Mucor mucedo]